MLEAPFKDAGLALAEIDKLLISLHLQTAQDKKTKTNGGEYSSPCPLCKFIDGGAGGTDRCSWWPYRPIFGAGSKENPIFACRICKRSGDLVGLYQQINNVTFSAALEYFNIGEYTNLSNGKSITPLDKLTGVTLPEDSGMMELVWAFVDQCVWNLWNTPAGEVALRYLRGRGLKDETILALKLGFNLETRYDDPALWGLDEEKDILIPKGIVIPEIHISPAGEQLIYSVSIRRSNKEILTYFEKHEVELARYHVIRLIGARSLYTIGLVPGVPATLHEGQLNAAISWQESGYGAAATQSSDGAQDNMLTTAKFLALVKCWILCMESDEAGKIAAKFWNGIIEKSIIHHPPVKGQDMNEFFLAGGNVKGFIDAGIERFEKTWNLKQHWTGKKLKPAETDEEGHGIADYDNELPTPVTKRTALTLEDAIFSATGVQERPLEDLKGSMHQPEYKAPENSPTDAKNLCMRCGAPGKHSDRFGNWYCSADIAAYRLIKDGGTVSTEEGRTIMFRQIYLKPMESILTPVFEGESWTMKEMPCDGTVRCVKRGRDNWLEFCVKALPGDLWRAATETHQILEGFTPYTPTPVPTGVELPCTRMGCMHNAAVPSRRNEEKRWDGRYKWPLYRPHTVNVEGKDYTFCAHCLVAAYLLDFAKSCQWFRHYELGVGDIEGAEEWVYFCATGTDYQIMSTMDIMRRKYKLVWELVQSRFNIV